MLEHDTCPVRPGFSLFVRGFVHRGMVGIRDGEGEEGNRGRRERSAVSPPRTRCHQAQLGMSLGHQHVYQAFFLDERVLQWHTSVDVCATNRITPLWSPLLSPIALFLSLISFHSPMTLRAAILSSLFLPRRTIRRRSSQFLRTSLQPDCARTITTVIRL